MSSNSKSIAGRHAAAIDVSQPCRFRRPEDRARWLVGAELPIDHVPPALDLGVADGDTVTVLTADKTKHRIHL
jgi:hypothetical protein